MTEMQRYRIEDKDETAVTIQGYVYEVTDKATPYLNNINKGDLADIGFYKGKVSIIKKVKNEGSSVPQNKDNDTRSVEEYKDRQKNITRQWAINASLKAIEIEKSADKAENVLDRAKGMAKDLEKFVNEND